MPAPVPFTLLLAPNGDVVYQELGELDIAEAAAGDSGQSSRRPEVSRPAGLLVQSLTMSEERMNRFDSTAAQRHRHVRRLALRPDSARVTALAMPRTRRAAQGQAPAQGGRGHPGRTWSIRCCRSGRRCRISPCPASTARPTRRATMRRTKVLAIVFESNHCPVSQLYEGRIEKLYEDYRRKGVTLVAINPNNPKTVRLDELGYTDVTDSLPGDEAARALPRHRLAVSVRRRHPGRVDQVRRRRHAAHLHLRPGAQAADTRGASTTTSAKSS